MRREEREGPNQAATIGTKVRFVAGWADGGGGVVEAA